MLEDHLQVVAGIRKEDRHSPLLRNMENTITFMANLKSHVNSDAPHTVRNLIASRFSHHPERYLEIFSILRKYELHHVAAQFMNHQHEEEEEEEGFSLDGHLEEEEDHAAGLAI